MFTIYYIFVALCQLIFLVWMLKLFKTSKHWYPIFPIIILLGIIYDNLVIGFGIYIGEGETLKNLNLPRYVIHALFTPTLIIFAFGVARRVGVSWAQSKPAHSLFCVFALALILYGSYHEILHLELSARAENGTLRYINENAQKPPIPAILTIIVSMIVGVFVWIKAKFPWYFVGSLLMFILAPFGATMVWVGNLGEIFMSFGNYSGEKVSQRESEG